MVLVVLLRRLLPSVENRTVADRFVGSCTVTNSPYTLGMVGKGGRLEVRHSALKSWMRTMLTLNQIVENPECNPPDHFHARKIMHGSPGSIALHALQ